MSVATPTKYQFYRFIAETVYIPLDYATPSVVASKKPKMWVPYDSLVRYIDVQEGEWITINPDQFGVYVIDYNYG